MTATANLDDVLTKPEGTDPNWHEKVEIARRAREAALARKDESADEGEESSPSESLGWFFGHEYGY